MYPPSPTIQVSVAPSDHAASGPAAATKPVATSVQVAVFATRLDRVVQWRLSLSSEMTTTLLPTQNTLFAPSFAASDDTSRSTQVSPPLMVSRIVGRTPGEAVTAPSSASTTWHPSDGAP